jgi:hypothetical protein
LAREANELWITEETSRQVQKVTTTGAILSYFQPGDDLLRDLAFDGENIWGVNILGTLRQYTVQGELLNTYEGLLSSGWGLTHETESGHLWVSDPGTDSLYRIQLPPEEICGDANDDGEVAPSDGYLILNYLGAGPAPASCWASNVNGDGALSPSDGFHLLNFIGSGSSLNCQPCEFKHTVSRRQSSIPGLEYE